MIKYTVLDTETTGLKGHCVSLAYRHYEDGVMVKEFDGYFLPPVPMEAEASKVNGITMDMLKDEPPISILNPEFQEMLNNTVLIAHNAPFDIQILVRDGFKVPFWICTCQLARHYMKEFPKHSLQHLREVLKLDDEHSREAAKAHTAMGDVVILDKLFIKILERANKRHPEMEAKELIAKFCNLSKLPKWQL